MKMDSAMCEHVYKEMSVDICPLCGKDTHRVDWKLQAELARKWKEENPGARYGGWWSI
jgi:rRNA maturation endonuclease Nob1